MTEVEEKIDLYPFTDDPTDIARTLVVAHFILDDGQAAIPTTPIIYNISDMWIRYLGDLMMEDEGTDELPDNFDATVEHLLMASLLHLHSPQLPNIAKIGYNYLDQMKSGKPN